MTVDKVLLFPSAKYNLQEADVRAVEAKLADFGIQSVRYRPGEEQEFEAVIALGGDGTMLNASKVAYKHNKPIMSVNFGTLGYMSCLEKSELNMLEALKSGFETEERMLIEITVLRKGKEIAEYTALNEAVIQRSAQGDIAFLELKCDNAVVCDYRADGIIIATPTGSSAYAMSAGGPIIDTKLEAICVCPICPHALGTRAMVFSPNSVLDAVSMNDDSDEGNILLSDGRKICALQQGDVVSVKKSRDTLKMIKLKKDAFYETLYKKMSGKIN